MATNLNAGRIGLRQAEPPEGRDGFVLGPAFGGGDGLNFATGAEVFSFNSSSIQGPIKPSAIMSMWIDASALGTATPNTAVLKIVTPTQTFIVQGGTQGYLICTSQVPFTLQISCSGAANTGTVKMILYNYNALNTGNFATGAGVGAGGTSSPSNPSGGGGGGISGSGTKGFTL